MGNPYAGHQLTDTEIYQLVLQARDGKQRSFERLLDYFSYLINTTARALVRAFPAIHLEDAKQSSRIGFWNAIKDYNPKRGTQLTTHAFNRIRSAHNRLKDQVRHVKHEVISEEIIDAAEQREPMPILALPDRERRRYRQLQTAIAKLSPVLTTALREKFNLCIPGPDIKLSDCPTHATRHLKDALNALRVEADRIIKEETKQGAAHARKKPPHAATKRP